MKLPPWSDAALEMRRKGKSIREISETLGMSITPIRENLLSRLNTEEYEELKLATRSSPRTDRIKSALENGEGAIAIAEREDCSRNWVYKIKNRNNRLVDKRIKNLADKDFIEKKLGMTEMTQEERNREIEEIEKLLR